MDGVAAAAVTAAAAAANAAATAAAATAAAAAALRGESFNLAKSYFQLRLECQSLGWVWECQLFEILGLHYRTLLLFV